MQRRGFSYTYPDEYGKWMEGFMAGNGKQGIIVFGSPRNDTIIFTDRDFNISRPVSRSFNKVSKSDLNKIKEYLVNEQWKEANDLADKVHGWQDGGDGNRHPGYKMTVTLPNNGEISNYMREVNYETGEILVTYTDDLGRWERKSFVSRKSGVTVQYIKAPEGQKVTAFLELDIDKGMNFPEGMEFLGKADVDYLKMRVKYPSGTNGAGYEGVTKVITDGGVRSLEGNKLIINGADSVLLLTKTIKYRKKAEDEWNKEALIKALNGISSSYSTLLKENIDTHGEIFNRVKLDLGGTDEDRSLSNEELIAKQKKTSVINNALYERIFDSGRFHFLCSSGRCETPDLLGNWTGDCNVGWNGYYHLDANLNLQIAGGGIGNMHEAMEGYFWLIEQWQEDLKINADKLLGVRGMLAAGNSPGASSGLISALSYYYPYQYVTGEMAWLLYPFWEHYLITGDTDFLRKRYYPLIREMGDFYEDFLTETDENGKYIFAGSISPENQPAGLNVSLVNNSAFDISGARFILKTLIKTCNILGCDSEENIKKWQDIYDRLPDYRINSEGALAEWSWEGLEDNYGHRHSSGLVPVWPYREITKESGLKLYEAAKETLRRKDRGSYEMAGHGLLHAMLVGAALHDERSIAGKLYGLITDGYYYGSLTAAHYNNHNVFCTDVLHAVPAIIIEMLVISDEGRLELLPALINEFQSGCIEGIKGRSRFTINRLSWNLCNGEIKCEITSDIDQILTIIHKNGIEHMNSDYGTIYQSELGEYARCLKVKKDKKIKFEVYSKRSQISLI